ncbi:MAG: hypothetical protein Athens041674_183 [Parcubacteria group bacterium Athens0416_74]|nr:MAG: hypothetical protein Athens041674_183 [Parcubacteria group bacterium Athens0416_74]
MEIPDDIRQCVVFLCKKKVVNGKEIYAPQGTGFLVSILDAESQLNFIYLVTALHNIENEDLDNISIRLNGKDGGRLDFVMKGAQWYTHPSDSNVDVAVIPFPLGTIEHAHKTVPSPMFLKHENIQNGDIQEANEVFVIGLFSQHHGKFANLPIVRVGNVALLSRDKNERVAVKWHNTEIDAYLIEARSIGGLSGSPVFFKEPYFKLKDNNTSLGGTSRIFLAGLIHGHWSVDSAKIDASETDASDNQSRINMGIAIVIPAEKILEVLMHPDLVKHRNDVVETQKKQGVVTPLRIKE